MQEHQESELQQDYFEHSRSLAVSFVFILPLLLFYETGMLLVRPVHASWAGSLVRHMMQTTFGNWATMVLGGVLILAALSSMLTMQRFGGVRFSIFPAILLESFAYGFLLTQLIPLIVAYGLPLAAATGPRQPSILDDVILSVGAGVYEEIVFRLGLMMLVYFLMTRISQRKWLAWAVAIACSSLLFSTSHYLGGIGEFTTREFIRSFGYRMIGGICFAGLFLYRGLAVACYSHAFYDVIVVAFRS